MSITIIESGELEHDPECENQAANGLKDEREDDEK